MYCVCICIETNGRSRDSTRWASSHAQRGRYEQQWKTTTGLQLGRQLKRVNRLYPRLGDSWRCCFRWPCVFRGRQRVHAKSTEVDFNTSSAVLAAYHTGVPHGRGTKAMMSATGTRATSHMFGHGNDGMHETAAYHGCREENRCRRDDIAGMSNNYLPSRIGCIQLPKLWHPFRSQPLEYVQHSPSDINSLFSDPFFGMVLNIEQCTGI